MVNPTRRFGYLNPQPARARGFTLIELLVVLAIVALLLTIAVPRYFGQLENTKEAVLRDNLWTTRELIDKFYADTGRYPESLDQLVERRYLRSKPIDPMTESADTWIFVAPPTGYQGLVSDLKSGAAGTSKDGRQFADW